MLSTALPESVNVTLMTSDWARTRPNSSTTRTRNEYVPEAENEMLLEAVTVCDGPID